MSLDLFSCYQTYGGFTTTPYWSSTDESGYNANDINFSNGSWTGHAQVDEMRNVRTIRAF
jgi:hypothetical protein